MAKLATSSKAGFWLGRRTPIPPYTAVCPSVSEKLAVGNISPTAAGGRNRANTFDRLSLHRSNGVRARERGTEEECGQPKGGPSRVGDPPAQCFNVGVTTVRDLAISHQAFAIKTRPVLVLPYLSSWSLSRARCLPSGSLPCRVPSIHSSSSAHRRQQ
ncbi:predicted protein [Plenodomus lingam JN3]|uniref:Predicted protein n=1 Tax=Leptosphaeria maculans (strain JN3 / isolate v23.1.3 / race Av1-4-5-6-7-8) TaxID=985895 RepID=E4ZMG6_LEPMJ|nr:predicted protein [Plenodomus lingam JN3]CBX92835.1 predicted protein [Plenodomus lingam JN3]